MRIVREIPHPRFKITVFSWNEKYIIKIEEAHLEQTFKIDQKEVSGLDEVEAMLTQDFLLKTMKRFVDMGSEFAEAWRNRYANLKNENS